MNYRNYRNVLVVLAITLCNFAGSDVLVAASNKPRHYRRSDKNRHHDETRRVRDIIKPHCSYCDSVFTNLKHLGEHIKNCPIRVAWDEALSASESDPE